MHRMAFVKLFDLSIPNLCLTLDLKFAKVFFEIFKCSWIWALEKLILIHIHTLTSCGDKPSACLTSLFVNSGYILANVISNFLFSIKTYLLSKFTFIRQINNCCSIFSVLFLRYCSNIEVS